MKEKEKIFMAVIVFFITVILVALMFVQFKTIDKTDVVEIETMQESELRAEITNWKTKYTEMVDQIDENNKKIIEYQEKIDNNQAAGELIASELEQKNMLSGKLPVKGEGVVVTLQDTSEGLIEAADLVELINELRYAGAEAISINDQRIIFNTYIVAVGTRYISVSGTRVAAPYVVKAIGNQAYLSSNLNLKNSGLVDRFNSNGKKVSVSLNSNIEMPAYSGQINLEHINN